MSIESKLEALTAAVLQLTQAISAAGSASVQQSTAAAQPAVAAPVAAPVPAPVAPPASAPAMPALPTFAATPAPAPAAPVASGAPFSDSQGLIQYTMASYQAMGPEKGARIQGVLQQLGYANINDVKPEHFAQFHQGVEALKAA